MDGLAPIDAWALLAILAKTTGYAAALVAMGGPLFVATFRSAPANVLRLARKLAVAAALVGLAVLALRFGIRSARISGMGLEGALDPLMLGLVWDSPLGTAALWRGAGGLLILAVLIERTIGLMASLLGALLVAVSYTLVGHSLGDPRWLLAGLVGAHLLAGAFWIGALAPLHRAADMTGGAALLHRFGTIASGTVAVLVLAGLTFAWLMIGSFGGHRSSGAGRKEQAPARARSCVRRSFGLRQAAPLDPRRNHRCRPDLAGDGHSHFDHHTSSESLIGQ